jgi:hypothetical protein
MKRWKTYSDWTDKFGNWQVEIISHIVSTLAAFQRKDELVRV